jgi:hypothetical protein
MGHRNLLGALQRASTGEHLDRLARRRGDAIGARPLERTS